MLDNDIISNGFLWLFKNKRRKISFDEINLPIYNQLLPRSRELLLLMISKVGYKSNEECLFITGTYSDFGFSNYQNFHRYKKDLIDYGFIVQVDQGYYVNPGRVDYLTKKQRSYFYKKLISPDIPVKPWGMK